MKPLEKLHIEQARLKTEIQMREKDLTEKLKFLENNLGKMAINSFLPFNSSQFDKASGIFTSINSAILKWIPGEANKQKYSSVLKTVEMAAAGLVYKYISRIIK